jgi:hypothetical protein
MREFDGRATCGGTGIATDSQTDAPEWHAVGSRGRGLPVVQDAENRIALALAYRQRVEIHNAACGSEDATPQGDKDRHSLATTDTGGERTFHTQAEQDADSREGDHRGDQDKVGRATRGGDLPPSARDLPNARDILPNIQLAEIDGPKLSDYSLNPDHPGNNGKANGWRALGYDVDTPEGRRDAAQELRGLICDELLARGKVAETRDTEYGPSHKVLSGLTGPNGRQATLVTCWLIEDRAGVSIPKLTTVWAQPHRDKETGR